MAFHTYTYLLSPAGLVSPAGHTLAHPDTGPCSTLLDIPLLIPAGYTIAHTGTCSALLDIPLLSLCSVLLDTDRLSPARHIRSALLPEIGPCSALLETTLQVLAQPCWTPLLSPAGNTIAQPYRCLLSPAGRPCSALLEILLLNPTGACSALLDALAQPCWKYYCSTLQVLAQPYWTQALAQPCWTQALTQPCWTQPCWFAQP